MTEGYRESAEKKPCREFLVITMMNGKKFGFYSNKLHSDVMHRYVERLTDQANFGQTVSLGALCITLSRRFPARKIGIQMCNIENFEFWQSDEHELPEVSLGLNMGTLPWQEIWEDK